ncbi:MAG TPA: OPT family oligopeptide transporter, partial [Candidatus Binatia bacterium]|nr:OPT family oligopeptide transporter [Candidatus Binatia bacterium]
MTTETVAETPARPVEAAPPPQTPEQIERHWFENVYAGDRMRQLTPRALIMGMLLGAFMSLSNIYIGLKAGWSMGVAITSCILAYAIFAALHRAFPKQFPAFSILENNAMQSCASAAGYMTGAGLVNAIPALMMLNPSAVPGMWALTIWTLVLSWLGVFLAVPAKRQMINVEQLPYPSGIAAATTMRALHSEGSKAERQAKALMWSGILGAAITWFRDASAPWIKYPNIPATWGTSWIRLGRYHLNELTMSFEGSLLFVAAGAIMGFRQAWSMMLGACVNYLLLAPMMMDQGVIATTGGSALRRISSWSLWIGVPMMVTSGLLLFFMQWRTVVRAFGTLLAFLKKRPGGTDDPMERIEVPGSWFVGGMIVLGGAAIYFGHLYFHIHWWMGLIAVLMTFFLVVVAARATGETDITPTGPISKITQLTFGAIQPGNVTTNLMTANITAGAVSHAGDLLTDLKSGYLLGANPRQQFIAQFFGVLAGGLVVVPVFFLLVPNASVLGTEQWPAPAAQVWRGVAELLSKGVGSLHPTAR